MKGSIFAKEFVDLKPKYVDAILRCRKSVLFFKSEAWIKYSRVGNFDIPQGSYNGAWVSELMGTFLLEKN